jgi:prevent-host-death family protein
LVTVGIRELKNNLSRFLSRVKSGEALIVTERGRAIARILREEDFAGSDRKQIYTLAQQGLVTLRKSELRSKKTLPTQQGGPQLSDMIISERR